MISAYCKLTPLRVGLDLRVSILSSLLAILSETMHLHVIRDDLNESVIWTFV